MYTHILKMPISAEQWRVSVGAMNASRRPCQLNKRWMCWEVFLLLLTALLVSTLLPRGGWRGTGSRSEYMNISRKWPEIPEQRHSYIATSIQCHCMCRLYTTPPKLTVCWYSLYVGGRGGGHMCMCMRNNFSRLATSLEWDPTSKWVRLVRWVINYCIARKIGRH